jgi:hypothetical protein
LLKWGVSGGGDIGKRKFQIQGRWTVGVQNHDHCVQSPLPEVGKSVVGQDLPEHAIRIFFKQPCSALELLAIGRYRYFLDYRSACSGCAVFLGDENLARQGMSKLTT